MSQTDLDKRIMRLFHSIAKVNSMKDALGKTVGDLIIVDGVPRRIVAIHASSKVDGMGYFFIDEDWRGLTEICVEISKTNGAIVSVEDVRRYLNELITEMKMSGWSRRGFLKEVRKTLQFIKEYKGEEAFITLPVWGLILKDSPLAVGDVEFRPRPVEQEIEEEIKRIDPNGNVKVIAVTLAHGDSGMIFNNAKTQVNKAINIIRAFACPIVSRGRLQEISFEGDYRSLRSVPISYSKPKVGGESHMIGIGLIQVGGVMPVVLEQHIDRMNYRGFGELLKVIQKNDKFSRRLVRGAEWIGEATKPDVLQGKFIKVAFAIDAMIGEAYADIPDSGKRARIAERAAFLLGKTHKMRDLVWRKMSDFVKKRDSIAHGSAKLTVTEAEVEEIGLYARSLLRRLLVKEPKFKDINQLAKWVKRQSLLG